MADHGTVVLLAQGLDPRWKQAGDHGQGAIPSELVRVPVILERGSDVDSAEAMVGGVVGETLVEPKVFLVVVRPLAAVPVGASVGTGVGTGAGVETGAGVDVLTWVGVGAVSEGMGTWGGTASLIRAASHRQSATSSDSGSRAASDRARIRQASPSRAAATADASQFGSSRSDFHSASMSFPSMSLPCFSMLSGFTPSKASMCFIRR